MLIPRMTTRRWMIAVAVVGIAFAAIALLRRHQGLRDRGDFHESREQIAADRMRSLEDRALSVTETNPVLAARVRTHAALSADLRDWHAHLKEKYRRAARYPWLPVEPDPPAPE